MFAGDGWHPGVVGIVASRVVERYHRPAFVLGDRRRRGAGFGTEHFRVSSIECPPGDYAGELFTKFGGHRQVRAGVEHSHLGASRNSSRRCMAHAASLLSAADFEAQLTIDSTIEFGEINDRSVGDDILSLAPFGFGNPSPIFMARDVEVAVAPEVKKERHVFLRLASQGRTLRVKAWNFADRVPELSAGAGIDAAFNFEDDPYSAGRGYAPWQTTVVFAMVLRQHAAARCGQLRPLQAPCNQLNCGPV